MGRSGGQAAAIGKLTNLGLLLAHTARGTLGADRRASTGLYSHLL